MSFHLTCLLFILRSSQFSIVQSFISRMRIIAALLLSIVECFLSSLVVHLFDVDYRLINICRNFFLYFHFTFTCQTFWKICVSSSVPLMAVWLRKRFFTRPFLSRCFESSTDMIKEIQQQQYQRWNESDTRKRTKVLVIAIHSVFNIWILFILYTNCRSVLTKPTWNI